MWRHACRRRRRRQLRRPGGDLAGARGCARDAAAPPRRPQRDDVGLPHPRPQPGKASPCAGRSEIVELHGSDGQLEAATLRDGERIPLSFLFLFLGAAPCSEWLRDTVALDDDAYVLTGQAAGVEGILETSAPGIFAVGDIRSGSIKRCATAVGEGAMVVRFVHQQFSQDPIAPPAVTRS